MGAVGLVAIGKWRVSCAGVGSWGGVTTASNSAYVPSSICRDFLRCPAGRYGRFLAVRVGDCERIADHAAAPGQPDPTQRVRRNYLQDNVVWLTCRDVCWSRYAVDDV
jgi:hypothetical protein